MACTVGGAHRCWRMILLACLIGLALAPGGIPARAQVSQDAVVPLDFAALLLRPSDLDQAGLGSDWGLQSGLAFSSVEDAVAADPYSHGFGNITIGNLDGGAQLLRNAGWLRVKDVQLATHLHPDAPPGTTSWDDFNLTASSAIEEFSSADGAIRAWEALTNPASLDALILGTHEPVALTTPLGDDAAMWKIDSFSVSNIKLTALTLWVRVDRFMLGVTKADFLSPDQSPQPQALVTLMQLLVSRLQAARSLPDHGGWTCAEHLRNRPGASLHTQLARQLDDLAGVPMPGLSTCLIRLHGPEAFQISDGYSVLDNQAIADFQESADMFADRQRDSQSRGLTAEYSAIERIEGNRPDGTPVAWFVHLRLSTFADDASAQAWMETMRANNADGTQPSQVVVGDESLILTATFNVWRQVAVVARVGNVVTLSWVESQVMAPPQEAVMQIAEAQVACLSQLACLDPVSIPPGLLGR